MRELVEDFQVDVQGRVVTVTVTGALTDELAYSVAAHELTAMGLGDAEWYRSSEGGPGILLLHYRLPVG